MQNTTHRHHGVVFNAVMSMFTGMVGDCFLMRCGFCALTDCLHFPASAQVRSSATRSHFSVLGRGSNSVCFCAHVRQVSQGWISWQEGRRGTGVSLSPCTDAAPSPLPRVPAEQSWEVTTATRRWSTAGHGTKQM